VNQQNKAKTVFKFDPPHNAEAVAIYRELMSIMERSCTSVGFQPLGELAPFFLGRFDEFNILCVRLDEDKAYVLKALQFKLGLTRACQQAGATTDLLRSMFLGATQNDEASDYTRSMIAASAKRKSSDSFGFDDEQQQPPQQQRRRASISSSPGVVGSGSPSPFEQRAGFHASCNTRGALLSLRRGGPQAEQLPCEGCWSAACEPRRVRKCFPALLVARST
jgi:hypothetical protein